MGIIGAGYIGDVEVGDIDDDLQNEVIFSYKEYSSEFPIIYVCNLVLTDESDPYSYELVIDSANVLDRPGSGFAIGDLNGNGKDEIVQSGQGGTIYDYDNVNEGLRKLYYSLFLCFPVVK